MVRKITQRFTLLALACLCGIGSMKAQMEMEGYQLPYSNFQEWEVGKTLGGKDNKNSIEEPKGWNSFATGIGSVISMAKNYPTKGIRIVDGKNRNYVSIKSYKVPILGIIANGTLTTGQICADSPIADNPEKNYNKTVLSLDSAGVDNFRQRFVGRPDSLIVFLQYIPKKKTPNADDVAQVSAWIHNNNEFQDPVADSNEMITKAIARALINPSATEAKDDFKRMTVAFDYDSEKYQGGDPAYILLTATTNKKPGGKGADKDELNLDSIHMVYISTLADIKIKGVSIEGFEENKFSYQLTEALEISDIAATPKGVAGKVQPITSNTENGVITYTIRVNGDDISVNPTNYTEYKLTYNLPAITNEITNLYNGTIDIDLSGMGEVEPPVITLPDQISIENATTDFNSIKLTLANFSFIGMDLGNISIDNIPVVVENETYSFESETVQMALMEGAIDADVKVTGTIVNGYANTVIDVIWWMDRENNLSMPIPVNFKGSAVADGLRLNDIKFDGVSVSDGIFDSDIFNYKSLDIQDVKVLTYDKADPASKVNIEMDGNWLYLNVTNGTATNSYKLANMDISIPINKISLGQTIDGNLSLKNNSEIIGLVTVDGTINYSRNIDANRWNTIGLPYVPTLQAIRSNNSIASASMELYTYGTSGSTYEAKQISSPTTAFIMRFTEPEDITSINLISPAGVSISKIGKKAVSEMAEGYSVYANTTFETVKLGDMVPANTDITYYLFDGYNEFQKAQSTDDLKPSTMFIAYKGSNPAVSVKSPDLALEIGDNYISDNNVKVYSTNGKIYIANYTGLAEVYAMNGGKVLEKKIIGSDSFDMTKGIYIVRTGTESIMVIVE
ncbi:MAG: calycin-like domain-containing protein [Dysgonomonas sp.]